VCRVCVARSAHCLLCKLCSRCCSGGFCDSSGRSCSSHRIPHPNPPPAFGQISIANDEPHSTCIFMLHMIMFNFQPIPRTRGQRISPKSGAEYQVFQSPAEKCASHWLSVGSHLKPLFPKIY